MAFTEAQVKSLEAKLDAKHVKTRRAQETTLNYVEGWHVIAEANRIFGYDSWDRQTLSTRCVWSGTASRHYAAAYTVKVRIVVRAGAITITREGCGSGEAKAQSPGEAHEIALKAAETDATKRALATFGNPFGLALYDRELAGVRNRKALALAPAEQKTSWVLRKANGENGPRFHKPEEFAEALKSAMTKASDIELLFSVWEQNLNMVRILKKYLNPKDKAPGAAEQLIAHLKQCVISFVRPPDRNEEPVKVDGEHLSRIDKSLLTLSEPKRVRSKEHLRFVARQPCLICGRTPSQAHHLRFAQSRGVALKVSDEFTVPLCAIHHSENHATGDERAWWQRRNIDPLLIAAALWRKSNGTGYAATTQ